MATSTGELILKFSGDPRQLKGVLAEIRSDLSKSSTAQISAARITNREIASEASKQTKQLEREERARVNAALALQRQRSAALIAQWRAEQREQVRLARDAARQVEEAQRAAQARRSAFISGAVGGLTALIGVSAISEIRQAGQAWLDYSNKLQTTQIAFTTMMGSAQLAQDHLKELQRFALKTPFQFGELIDASQRMQALGFRAEQVIPILTDVGNAVAAAGGGSERLDRVTLALSQIQSKGKVMTQELNQLAEAGIPSFKILQQELGKSRSQINELTKDGQISSKVFLDAFQKFSQQNFGGLMEAQSKTFSGAMSNIKDALLQTSATAFAPLFEKLTQTAVHFSEASQSSTEFKSNLETVGRVSATIFDGLAEVILAVRDAIRIVAAAISGEITFVVETVKEGFHLLQASIHQTSEAIQLLRGDAAGAAVSHRKVQDELREGAISAKKAFDAQANTIKTIISVYREAEERAKALANAQAAVGIDIGLAPEFQKGFKRPSAETEDDLTKKTKDKVDAGVSVLRQLQGELRSLTTVTKAQEIAQQLLDERYKNTNASLRQQIVAAAQLIDLAKERIEVDRKIKEETEKQEQTLRAAAEGVSQFMQEQAETLRELQFGPKSAAQETEEFITKLELVPGAITEIDKEWLRYRAHLIDSINRMREMLDLMREQAAVVPGPGTGTVPEFNPNQVFDADTLGVPPPELKLSLQELIDKAIQAHGVFAGLGVAIADSLGLGASAAAAIGDTLTSVFEGIADAVGQAVEAFVLYGKIDLRKVTAQIIASIAAQAAAKAAFELAEGLAMLALAFFGHPGAGPSASAHFAAAAAYGAIAGIAAVAGRAVAGNSFQKESRFSSAGSSASGASPSSRSTTTSSQPQTVDLDRLTRSQQNVVYMQPIVNVTVTGQATEGFKYMVEKANTQSYREGGVLNNIVRHAMGDPGFAV